MGLGIASPINSVSNIKNIKVAARSSSGLITHILIETSTNKYLVAKELDIRKLLATEEALYGAKGEMDYYNENPRIKSVSLLPSASFAIEDNGNSITIYGSGNGHGVGMPQYSSYDMASRGYKL